MLTNIKDRPELTEALARANAWFNALTPEQQKVHREEQRRSWVIGEMMLSHPDMTRDDAIALYESVR